MANKSTKSTKTTKKPTVKKTDIKKSDNKKKRIKKIIASLCVILFSAFLAYIAAMNTNKADYVVETNAFFAPFEYYEGRQIVGVDVEIINRVAKKMDKKIVIKDVEFDVIIDNVAAGKIADAGAAGLTITPARAEKVNFSIPYYTSVQYIIYSKDHAPELRNGHTTWDIIRNSTIGTQTGSTGYIFASDEIENLKGFDSHQLAADAIASHIVDYAVADQLAAEFIVSKNPGLASAPLYYQGATIEEDYPVEESYAIAVNKEKTELLDAFNEVLTEMTKKDPKGISEIDRLVIKYMGLSDE
ncbi:transporter substrate-binding domain-containing protein [Candidatus Saccharibacteria bacterium]|nr:transporter substrate-binding domain-containing protein [Candidatus Saccharibacteria bacterium]